LIADIAPVELRGASFGLRQSLDTVGAVVGPLLAIGILWLTANNFHTVFWIAVIRAFLSLALLMFAVNEPERPAGLRKALFPLGYSALERLGSSYWLVVIVATIFTLARFSEAFLILRAQAVGLPLVLVPLVLVVMNVVYALAAYPAGVLSDRYNRLTMLTVGFSLLIAADLVLAFSNGLAGVAIGVALWGLHLGITQGLLATLIADTAPAEIAWAGLRCFQPAGRTCAAGGKRSGGCPLGQCWSSSDIPCGRCDYSTVHGWPWPCALARTRSRRFAQDLRPIEAIPDSGTLMRRHGPVANPLVISDIE
jgi:MFS family permease